MIVESLGLIYHVRCFRCCVCHASLGTSQVGADVRVKGSKLHCYNCYSSEEGKTQLLHSQKYTDSTSLAKVWVFGVAKIKRTKYYMTSFKLSTANNFGI